MSRSIHFFEPVNASTRERLFAVALTASSLVALLFLRHFNPVGSGLFPPCPFRALTGLNCPGCGTTRGLHALLNGHPVVAFDFNPLMVLMLPFMAYVFLSYALVALRGRGLPKVYVPNPLIWVIFWVIISFWVLRNIPLYPLTLLAP
ncbi:MAG: DUF2752 domain-containing protein [Pyrinomonadaceae bacterium]